MVNRRLDYRHVFPPPRHLPLLLKLRQHDAVEARIVDLSLVGLQVQLAAPADLTPHERVVAQWRLPTGQVLDLPAVVVRVAGQQAGLRFLPSADDAEEQGRSKALWLFLLREQRRARQALLEATESQSGALPA